MAQTGEVLGQRRLAQADDLLKLADALFAFVKRTYNSEPPFVGKRLELIHSIFDIVFYLCCIHQTICFFMSLKRMLS